MASLVRVMKDLVLKSPPTDLADGAAGGRHGLRGGVGNGLATLARVAWSPLTAVPRAAAQLPELLGALGARGLAIPAHRRQAPNVRLALRALGGLWGRGPELQSSYLSILTATMDSAVARDVHPSFLEVLEQLDSDELRLLASLDTQTVGTAVSVVSRLRYGGASRTELRNFTLLGERAGCDRPERAPAYLDNLARLGLVEIRSARITDDLRPFAELESHPVVLALKARVEAEPQVVTGATSDTIVADVQPKVVSLTSFGRQFRGACAYRAELQPGGTA